MKKILILIISLYCIGCEKPGDKLLIINDSDENTEVFLSYDTSINSIEHFQGFTTILRKHDSVRPPCGFNNYDMVTRIDHGVDNKLYIYVFTKGSYNTMTIRLGNYFRVGFTKEELDGMNWRYVYIGDTINKKH